MPSRKKRGVRGPAASVSASAVRPKTSLGPSLPPRIGWREWVRLPDFEIPTIKAKVDTGARTSSLHAFDMEEVTRRGRAFLRFAVHPEQRSARGSVRVEAPLVERRRVRSSSGHTDLRPVVRTKVELLGMCWEVELTLTSRDEMGFRMLLGRQALRGRFLVDPGASFLNGRRKKGTRRLLTKPKRS